MSTRRAVPSLHIPIPAPSQETALFQHSPSADSKVRQEWEPGCQPDEVYDAALPAWRAWARRYLVGRLRKEREWMAGWQASVRTESRDKFFYWTAIFGSEFVGQLITPERSAEWNLTRYGQVASRLTLQLTPSSMPSSRSFSGMETQPKVVGQSGGSPSC